MRIRRQYLCCASAMLLVSALSSQCLAQSATPQLSLVTITHVKPDMLNEWLDLQKNEVVPALKKAGQTTRTVYHTSLFGNSYEYVAITPIQKFAQFDAGNPLVKALGETAAARLGEKLRKCTESSASFASARLADLSNVLDGPPPQMIVSARFRIAPGKTAEFQSLVKSEILPVYKKAKVGLTVNQRSVGTNPNDVTMTTAYSKFADLDGGPLLVKQLGQDGANKVNAKFTGIRTLIEVVVRTRVADLSF